MLRRQIAGLLLLLVAPTVSTAQQHCGGAERWAVKDGTDPAALQINLSNITDLTLDQLVHLPQPTLPGDDTTRVVPSEAHVYRIKAHLVKWKHECCKPSDDNDYHLVISDDTGKYSDEHSGISANPPHSFVAEIPNADCLSGRDGDFGASSPFVETGTPLDFAKSRQYLEQHTPNFKSNAKWNEMGNVPVEVVGVGFFDRPHQQTGRSINNIEIHPVLSLKFLDQNEPADVSPAAETATTTTPPGPNWEYRIITATTASDLVNHANDLGTQGWELVSVVIDELRPDKFVGYLKRRK